MKKPLNVAVWLLILIVGLPQLSETIYTPSLPDIARDLSVADKMVEFTLTLYLFGFGIGTLIWGKLSDHLGRKPCMLGGLIIYILGCLACYYSDSIEGLLISRFIQAFGGSVGSVLGQAICRDAFQGIERGKVYSTIGSTLAVSPAIGPLLGGFTDQMFGWHAIFLTLIVFGLFVLIVASLKLPETHKPSKMPPASFVQTLLRMAKDLKVLAFGFLVAACNGIIFSYYAEGSFFLIDLLGLTPSQYGSSFLSIAAAGILGGYLSRRMHSYTSSLEILGNGLKVVLFGTTVFCSTVVSLSIVQASPLTHVIFTLTSMFTIMVGIGMILPNALSLALEGYQHAIGTASSIFGFSYYTLISLFTFGMGILHNNTLFPMPLYFLAIGISMSFVYKTMIVGISKPELSESVT